MTNENYEKGLKDLQEHLESKKSEWLVKMKISDFEYKEWGEPEKREELINKLRTDAIFARGFTAITLYENLLAKTYEFFNDLPF